MSGVVSDNIGRSSGLVKSSAVSGGKVVQVTVATGSASASTASTGTSAVEIVSTTFTPTSDSNSLIIQFTGGGSYGADENGESKTYITYHPNGGSEALIFSSSPIGDETDASRHKMNVVGTVVKTSPGTAEQTIRLRANGTDVSGNTVTVEWVLQLIIWEISA
jgi:hypothetical protein